MIYTLTLSPSLDYYMEVEDFTVGKINRSKHEQIKIGGKGLNVTMMLKEINVLSTAIICTSSFTGDEIKNELKANDINFINIPVDGMNRINVKVLSNTETAINANGVFITKKHADYIIECLSKLQDGDYLVIAGNVSSNIIFNIYEYILTNIKNENINLVIDVENNLLELLKFKPFLIKPNLDELEKNLNVKLNSTSDIYNAAIKLINLGAKNVLVSLGDKGLLFVDSNNNYIYKEALDTQVIDTTGAGDSLLAGFLGGICLGENIEESLELGLACATATVSTLGLGNINKINEILKK